MSTLVLVLGTVAPLGRGEKFGIGIVGVLGILGIFGVYEKVLGMIKGVPVIGDDRTLCTEDKLP